MSCACFFFFFKTRCFLGMLTNKSRWGKLESPSFRHPLRTFLLQKIAQLNLLSQQSIPNEKLPPFFPSSAKSQDDIIVRSRNLAKYNEPLNKVFLKIRKKGLKLNKNKLAVKSIVLLEHITSSKGVKINPAKIEVTTKMSLPNSVNKFQWFLGMITYIGKFISNLAEVTSPLRIPLIKKLNLNSRNPS